MCFLCLIELDYFRIKYMKHIFTKIFFALAFILFAVNVNAQVAITDSATAVQLVQKLVGTGISFSNPTMKCKENAEGTFSVVTSNLGLTGGIILTSGNAEGASALSPLAPDNCNEAGEGGGDQLSDPDLDSLVTVSIHDACVLEFDFVPDGDSLLFDYVFGSEEYDNFSCTVFNDIFGFFLSGPNITGTLNVALVPGTNIPVTVNSINDTSITLDPGQTSAMCIAMGPGSPFAQYYNDNSAMQTVTYYGLTTVLTARAEVVPCSTYHIKLAIGDGSDCALSSGVFLQENSFRSNDITLDLKSSLIGEDGFLVEGCTQGTITAKRSRAVPTPKTILLSYTGSATYGIDYDNPPTTIVIPPNDSVITFTIIPSKDNIEEGVEEIVINILNPCNNNVMDSIVIPIYEFLEIELLSEDTFMCGAQPVRLEASGNPNYNYTWTSVPDSRIDDPNAMSTHGYPDSSTVYSVKASYFTCESNTYSFNTIVEPEPQVDILTEDKEVCLGAPLQLEVKVGPDYYTDYSYLWFPPTGLSDVHVKEPFFFVNEPGTYSYVLTVQTATLGCTGRDTLTLEAKPAALLTDVTPDFTIKYGDRMQLNAAGVPYYTWIPENHLDYPNSPTPTAVGLEPTTFAVIGMNEYGCKDTAYVKMDIDYTMHEILPTAFSPNGDGRNDVFSLKNMNFQRVIEFKVYNRWGQEVFSTTDNKQGWDGTYKGVPQQTGVYNYIIRVVIPDGKQRVYKGDVTLLR